MRKRERKGEGGNVYFLVMRMFMYREMKWI